VYNTVFFKVAGEPASKANQRKMVMFGKKPAFIKSQKARDYEKSFESDCPQLDKLFEGDLEVEMKIYYSTRRPDLDESLILDCMQGKIYANDRQVKAKKIYWGLDKKNPRTVIRVTKLNEIDTGPFEVPERTMMYCFETF
tara:strand:- start:705 stop:1124 length:420 start_codon:yes stop_codon:yes gene_type:complete